MTKNGFGGSSAFTYIVCTWEEIFGIGGWLYSAEIISGLALFVNYGPMIRDGEPELLSSY
jgi:hypothetical protein